MSEPPRSFQTLLGELQALTKNLVRVEGTGIIFCRYACPTPLQERAFKLFDIVYRM